MIIGDMIHHVLPSGSMTRGLHTLHTSLARCSTLRAACIAQAVFACHRQNKLLSAGWRTDWKVLCICTDLPLAAKLHDIADIERSGPGHVACTLPQDRLCSQILQKA